MALPSWLLVTKSLRVTAHCCVEASTDNCVPTHRAPTYVIKASAVPTICGMGRSEPRGSLRAGQCNVKEGGEGGGGGFENSGTSDCRAEAAAVCCLQLSCLPGAGCPAPGSPAVSPFIMIQPQGRLTDAYWRSALAQLQSRVRRGMSAPPGSEVVSRTRMRSLCRVTNLNARNMGSSDSRPAV